MTPVTVLTGFLGSGKTTILNHLLGRPELADTVVIINEFGEIGLDHLLVRSSTENLVLLNNGCLCCTVRGDLVETITDLQVRLARGAIMPFRRIVVETTGLADPAPILHTLMADPAVTRHHRLQGVITTVDAVNGTASLNGHAEAVKQVAVADRILLTKTDLAASSLVAELRQRLQALNPGTPICATRDGVVDPSSIFDAGLYAPAGKTPDVQRWLHAEAYDTGHAHRHAHDVNRHDAHIQAHCFTIDAPVRWAEFAYWLELLAAMRGEEMLRVKGIVAIAEHPDRPLVIHGVQHVFHPPVTLDAWPSDDHRTRMVFITRDIERSLIERTLAKFAGVLA